MEKSCWKPIGACWSCENQMSDHMNELNLIDHYNVCKRPPTAQMHLMSSAPISDDFILFLGSSNSIEDIQLGVGAAAWVGRFRIDHYRLFEARVLLIEYSLYIFTKV